MRLQKRLSKVEAEGIVQPSIMFTRLDAERNEQTLKQAADKGKLPEITVNVSLFTTNTNASTYFSLRKSMEQWKIMFVYLLNSLVTLLNVIFNIEKPLNLKVNKIPSDFCLRLVYILDRIQSETFDNETKSVMEKMGSYYERVCLIKHFFIHSYKILFSVLDKSVNVYQVFVNIVQH
jgi:hypothetical protein